MYLIVFHLSYNYHFADTSCLDFMGYKTDWIRLFNRHCPLFSPCSQNNTSLFPFKLTWLLVVQDRTDLALLKHIAILFKRHRSWFPMWSGQQNPVSTPPYKTIYLHVLSCFENKCQVSMYCVYIWVCIECKYILCGVRYCLCLYKY